MAMLRAVRHYSTVAAICVATYTERFSFVSCIALWNRIICKKQFLVFHGGGNLFPCLNRNNCFVLILINPTSTLLSCFCNLGWKYSVQATWNIVVCLLLRELALFRSIITSLLVTKVCQMKRASKSDIFLCLIVFVMLVINRKRLWEFV